MRPGTDVILSARACAWSRPKSVSGMVSGAVVDRPAFAALWACLTNLTTLAVSVLTLSVMRHPNYLCFGGEVCVALILRRFAESG